MQVIYGEPGVTLSFMAQTGDPPSDGGDAYIGFDRFDRVEQMRWLQSTTALVHLQYGFDPAGNRLWRQDLVAGVSGSGRRL